MNTTEVAIISVLITAAAGAIITPLMSWLFTRRRDADRVRLDQFNSETDRFTALFNAQGARIDDLEAQVTNLNSRLDEKDRQAIALQAENATLRNELTNVKATVRRYFEQVRVAWGKGGSMPMPSLEDMHMLELPIPLPAETGPIETKGTS